MTKHVTPSGIVIEFRQHDWSPGYAAYLAPEGPFQANGPAFCILDLAAFLGGVATGQDDVAGMVEAIADTMLHEVLHVIEHWAGAEFSEDRVNDLIARYRGHETISHVDAVDQIADDMAQSIIGCAEGDRAVAMAMLARITKTVEAASP